MYRPFMLATVNVSPGERCKHRIENRSDSWPGERIETFADTWTCYKEHTLLMQTVMFDLISLVCIRKAAYVCQIKQDFGKLQKHSQSFLTLTSSSSLLIVVYL